MAISLNPLYNRKILQTNYFTASETKSYGNDLLAFKEYIMEESKDLKYRLKVFSNLGNASYTHEKITILKEEIRVLREDNKNKSIII